MVASRRLNDVQGDGASAPEGADAGERARGWRMGQVAVRRESPPGDGPDNDIEHMLDQAAGLIDEDSDSAALLLNDALAAIVERWYAAQDFIAPERQLLLADLRERSAPLAWQLRLALRAPDVRSRLIYARGLAGAVSGYYESVVACGARPR